MTPLERVLDALQERGLSPKRSGDGYMSRCPAHDDKTPSLSCKEGKDGRVLINCFAGCGFKEILSRLGLTTSDLFTKRDGGGRGEQPSARRATVQPPGDGLSLQEYALAKQFDIGFLKNLGLTDLKSYQPPAVSIPYRDVSGQRVSTRYRTSISQKDAFRWKKGDKPLLYGLWRLPDWKDTSAIILVEGESDTQTLWSHGFPALGIPGASTWKNEWAVHLEPFDEVYFVVEPDKGGENLLSALASSPIRDRLRLIRLDGTKDVSELHLSCKSGFREALESAMCQATLLADELSSATEQLARQAFDDCKRLVQSNDLLTLFGDELAKSGVVGEERTGRLLFLAAISRLLPKPVSIVVKGTSSAGKSFIVERVLNFFPESEWYAVTAMSERSLAYSEEPLVNRILVIYEAAGLTGEFSSYLLRSLLSEHCVRYETVEKTRDGLKSRIIHRPGPTCLFVTTTEVSLHKENETRLLTVTVSDSPAQTRRVLECIANEDKHQVAAGAWHALQVWLRNGPVEVSVPFAREIVDLMPPVAVRLRRDLTKVLGLIKAHALLHRATRDRDERGMILATLEDYTAVYALVADLLAEGLEASIPPLVRETVDATRKVLDSGKDGAMVVDLATELKLDKSAASRRAREAVARGFIKNNEVRRGRPAAYVLDNPMPDDIEVLPSPSNIAEVIGCTVARDPEGLTPPPPLELPVPVVGQGDEPWEDIN